MLQRFWNFLFYKKIIPTLLAFFCLGLNAKAQLIVNPNVTPGQLVANLTKQGLVVSNVQLNCAPGAFGTFDGSGSNIGIQNGILLTNGKASNAVGPNNSSDVTYDNQIKFADPDLTKIVPSAVFDPCILEFDVIPHCDSLEISFVFGSEEYMEYVNQIYDDAFGFFITGPKPGGGNYSAVNIATLPGTNIQVSVDSVNLNNNSSYYFDNENPQGQTVEYDGFTKLIKSKIALVPCASYHFKIIIADAGDGILDSGVLIDYLACTQALSLNKSSTPVTSCAACDGTAGVNASNGNFPYTYSWSNGATTSTISNLCAGKYIVTITDNGACPMTATDTIIVGGNNNLTLSTSFNNVKCNSSCNGKATVTAFNGNPGYTYQWFPSGGSGPTASNLCTGTYSCTVTDLLGCSLSETFTITKDTLMLSYSKVNTCDNQDCQGSVAVTVVNGSSPYSYSWSPSQGNVSMAEYLCYGTYSVTVTDASGCKASLSTKVDTTVALSATINTSSVSCYGADDGWASITGTGGSGLYHYAWSTGEGLPTTTGLKAGVYTATVTDLNCCVPSPGHGGGGSGFKTGIDPYDYESTCIYTVTFTIAEPTILQLNPSTTPTSCGLSNGSASVAPTGGNSSYQMLWNTGSTSLSISGLALGVYSVTVTDGKGCSETALINVVDNGSLSVIVNLVNDVTCSGGNDGQAIAVASNGAQPYTYNWPYGSTTEIASNLPAGTHTLTVTDLGGCMITSTISIGEPPPLTLSLTASPAACLQANGTATAIATGGTSGHQFTWNTGSSLSSISNLLAGTYSATVTDGNSCTMVSSVNVDNVGAPIITTTITPVSCFGYGDGMVTTSVTGGSQPYTYNWTNGSTIATASNLTYGAHTLTVTDMASCITTATVNITEPSPLTLSLTATPASCAQSNGAVTAVASGGVSGYQFIWNTGGTSDNINGLIQGPYTVTVTDNNGCAEMESINITDNGTISISFPTVDNALCFGTTDGMAEALVTGGTEPYTYNWNNGSTGTVASNLAAGTHTLTVTDMAGCISTTVVSITEPPPLTLSLTTTPAACIQSNGTATAVVSGGALGYKFKWDTGSSLSAISNLSTGTYSITVTDENNCSIASSIYVDNVNTLTVSPTFSSISCYGANDGSASVTVTGGSQGYTFSWNIGGTNNSISNLSSGIYTVTVTDNAGCTSSTTTTITEPTELLLSVSTTTVICRGQQITLTAGATGGTTPYVFSWQPNNQTGNSISVSPQSSTTYSILATDKNNCISPVQVTSVDVNPLPLVSFQADSLSGCSPLCITFTNTTPDVSQLTWQFGDGNSSSASTPSHCFTSGGSFTVKLIATDNAGCIDSLIKNNYINIASQPQALFTANPQPATIINPLIKFTDLSQGDITSWQWFFEDEVNGFSSMQHPQYLYNDIGEYDVTLIVMNQNGCMDSLTTEIQINPDFTLYIPNTFTPNNDGINEIFLPKGLGIDPNHFKMSIYNRWGEKIYETTDFYKGWNGKDRNGLSQIDVYVYRIETLDIFQNPHVLLGHISLIK